MTPEQNERLVRIGRGQPAGEMLRRYWLPALLSAELPECDGAPIRVRLMAEDLIAFRDSNNRVGLVDQHCPHRRAPLFFGRNEDCGIRCSYHGWKFDVDGKCLETPAEPADSQLKDGVRLLAYPTVERGGVVWAYLGARDAMPAPPDYEWLRVPATHRFVTKSFEHCNYLQALEGGMDTSHSSYLHNNSIGNMKALRNRDTAPRTDIEVTDYGYTYISHRDLGDEGNYVRVYHFVMPNQQMRGTVTGWFGGNRERAKLDGHIWVPIDDENTLVYNWCHGYDASIALSDEDHERFEASAGRGKDDFIPGTFVLKRNPANDYLVDRRLQKTQSFTGITGINTQDYAMQEGMGCIADRSRETLGVSDRAIVVMRRLLNEAIDAAESGNAPRGVDPSAHRNIRPHDGMVPPGGNWREAFAENLRPKW